MKIAFCGYRDWANTIYNQLAVDFPNIVFCKFSSKEQVERELKPEYDFDLILFVGWSWIIKDNLIKTGKCVCFHPSPLPKYRGGSPLQNQIIAGETQSAVSLIIMDNGIDTGPILCQTYFSLEGDLADVILSMQLAGIGAINWLIKSFLCDMRMPSALPQDERNATTFKRRKEAMSEITPKELNESTPLQLHNKIRSLQDPYPNAYIKCGNGEKLYIIKSKV